jgi:8-oxo-dGTP pyrophosphatase MutT (NUDIX family)
LKSEISLDFNKRLKEALLERQTIKISDEKRKPSSVLIPVYYSQGQHFIVFTKRTNLVQYHKGEISFPGGGHHEEDGMLVNTALREAWEEIGLKPEDVEILGEMDDSITKWSPYIITPFAGAIPSDYEFKLNEFETAEIIHIPVLALLETDCRKEGEETVSGKTCHTYFYSYQNHSITGATARILKQFLDIYARVENRAG